MNAITTLALVLSLVAGAIATFALTVALSAQQRIAQLSRPGRAQRQEFATQRKVEGMTETEKKRQRRAPWVIYNPVKVEDFDHFREVLVARAQATGYLDPKFVETTEDSPGTLQALQAVHAGADLVIAAGGDGTQRAVAAGMAHSGIPIGIIPAGTGNLLARNLELPIGSLEDAVEVALTGSNFKVDLGWMEICETDAGLELPAEGAAVRRGIARMDGSDNSSVKEMDEGVRDADTTPATNPDVVPASDAHTPWDRMKQQPVAKENEYAFLVMSGVGFDADMMASTNPKLKKSIGWLAYVVSGVREHRSPRLRATLRLGDDAAGARVKARTILLANCGQLPGNVALLPDAAPGDGWIDLAVLDTRRGVLGWAELGWRIVAQGFGVKRGVPSMSSTLKTRKARAIDVRLEKHRHVQVDGDVVAKSTHVKARLDRGALTYRIP